MKFFKFLILLALVASAGSLAGSWFLYQRYQAEVVSKSEMESRIIQLEEQNKDFEKQTAKVGQYEQEQERLREQLKAYVGQRDKLKTELDDAFSEIAQLKKQIHTLETGKKTLEEQINEGQVTETAVAREAEKIANLPPTPILTEEPYPGVTETAPPPPVESKKPEPKNIEPPKPKETAAPEKSKSPAPGPAPSKTKPAPPALTPAPASAPAPKKEAPFAPLPTSEAAADQRPLQVLSVNRQFKFVVINGGIRGSIKIGDALRVEQNGKLIGRIQVEKLYENFSACNILEEIAPAEIREGDLVRLA